MLVSVPLAPLSLAYGSLPAFKAFAMTATRLILEEPSHVGKATVHATHPAVRPQSQGLQWQRITAEGRA